MTVLRYDLVWRVDAEFKPEKRLNAQPGVVRNTLKRGRAGYYRANQRHCQNRLSPQWCASGTRWVPAAND